MGETSCDPIYVIRFVFGTSAPCNLVAVARRWRFTAKVGIIEAGPESGVFEQVLDPDRVLRGVGGGSNGDGDVGWYMMYEV